MRQLLFGLVAGALGLTLAGSASAHDRDDDPYPYRPRGPRPPADVRNYHRDHGVRYRDGYYYRGRQHDHWARRVWDARHRRYHYWDAGLRCYYHWCPDRRGYYPVDPRPW